MRQFDYSKLKAIAWDSEVLSLVAQIHECKGRQEMYLAQKPAALDRLVEIAKVQSTEASNKIEGIVTTNTRIRCPVGKNNGQPSLEPSSEIRRSF